jgi:hypothetical protein
MSHHTDAQPPPTRIRKRMISDEAAWLQGNTPRTPICSPSGPLPKLSGRLGTPELATKEREIIRAGHAALRHHTAGLSERRGAQPPAALAIPRDAGVPARSQTAVPGAKAACGLLVLERPHTTSALSSSTSVTAVPAGERTPCGVLNWFSALTVNQKYWGYNMDYVWFRCYVEPSLVTRQLIYYQPLPYDGMHLQVATAAPRPVASRYGQIYRF